MIVVEDSDRKIHFLRDQRHTHEKKICTSSPKTYPSWQIAMILTLVENYFRISEEALKEVQNTKQIA